MEAQVKELMSGYISLNGTVIKPMDGLRLVPSKPVYNKMKYLKKPSTNKNDNVIQKKK